MNIKEIKKKYPKYSKLPDAVLAQRIYEKHFADTASPEQFSKSIGVKVSEPQGFLEKLPANIMHGLLEGRRNIVNFPGRAIEKISPTAAEYYHKAVPYEPSRDYAMEMGVTGLPTTADRGVRGVEQMAAAVVAPEMESAEALGLGKKMTQFLKGAPGQAAFGAIQDEDDPLRGAAGGVAASAMFPALMKAGESMAGGRKAVLRQNPEVLEDYATKILNSLGTDKSHGQSKKSLMRNALDKWKKARKAKRGMFKDADKMAEDLGFKAELPEFHKQLQEDIGSLKESEIFQNDQDAQDLLKKVSRFELKPGSEESKILSPEGSPLTKETPPRLSLKDANLLKHKLYKLKAKHEVSLKEAQTGKAATLGRLASTLDREIGTNLDKFGSDELTNSFRGAQENYKQNYLPWLNKKIYKHTEGPSKGDHDSFFNTFFKAKGADDPTFDMENLLKAMKEPEDRKQIAHAYLSKARKAPEKEGEIGKVDATEMGNLFGRMGPEQRDILVPYGEKLRSSLDELESITSPKGDASFAEKYLPTGAHAQTTGALIGSLVGGGAPGAAVGYMAPMAAKMASKPAARAAAKTLKRPKYEAALSKVIKGDEAEKPLELEVNKFIRGVGSEAKRRSPDVLRQTVAQQLMHILR